jgi:16S rRNA (cytosine967-C5)-methyltransferase
MARMKMHRPLAEATTVILHGVFHDRKVLDHTLHEAFAAHPQWGKRDRAFIAETVFEVTRWRRALEFVAGNSGIPALCTAQWSRMGFEIPDWWQYGGASPAEMAACEAALPNQPRAVRESIPDWLDAAAAQELGSAWDAELAALNRRAPVFLRVNTLCNTTEEAISWLAAAGVECAAVPGLPHALVLPTGKSLPKPLLDHGRVELQDAGSQTIAPLIDPQPGECVIDSCSGAGGKTLHLAALMQNQGRIYAMDVNARKLDELTRRAKRARATCIRTKSLRMVSPADFAGMADRLLIDAPCSGLGTLRRQPDLKWRLTPHELDVIRAKQKNILREHSVMLKPGGVLVYATCSILPSENHAAIEPLIADGACTLLSEHPVSPAATGFDGFHAIRLLKH